MTSFAAFGNDLYTGKRSIGFVEHRRRWYLISAALIAIALVGLGVMRLNLGMEFTGGSEFRVAAAQDVPGYEDRANEALQAVEPGQSANVTKLGTNTIRVQTEQLDDAKSAQLRESLAQEFGVGVDKVSASFVGPSWGQSLSQQALRALVVFLTLTALLMAIYFRTWKMAAAAMVALVHDMVITVGVYALSGFEVSPATMIGFLTVLGYSLYDTVVVFDKVRENTNEAFAGKRMTYAQAANLAVNQTVVRSINTTVVALLPIFAVLVVGFSTIGPGTLLDLALVLFIGMGVGAYSSIFIATPVLVSMRTREPAVQELDKAALRHQARRGAPLSSDAVPATGQAERSGQSGQSLQGEPSQRGRTDDPAEAGPPGATPGEEQPARQPVSAGTGRATPRKTHPYAQSGPRNQPKRPPKSRR